ncbi:hypothetical protein ONS95_010589 [Cadophora gregata]|uniref:uncharacterized protein n=1 Tax=Cadophora gregata TaxID=51156 RepID=UPI0026DDBFA7|nr:uncharacterized protein ONS95_010589 [Cadophora gregata]KAK0122348.1 hypothetical protein ONS95_010589 [Cadophora gregata]KAK0127825.1 hypothetical protein ONS96_007328 [Cadophora gregata f. sp. sojae]
MTQATLNFRHRVTKSTPRKVFFCTVCSHPFGYKSPKVRDDHIRRKHTQERLMDLSNTLLESQDDLEEHNPRRATPISNNHDSNSSSEKGIPSTSCSESSSSEQILPHNQTQKNWKGKHICLNCNAQQESQDSLEQHIRSQSCYMMSASILDDVASQLTELAEGTWDFEQYLSFEDLTTASETSTQDSEALIADEYEMYLKDLGL